MVLLVLVCLEWLRRPEPHVLCLRLWLQVLVMVVIEVAFGFFAHMVLGARQETMSTLSGAECAAAWSC